MPQSLTEMAKELTMAQISASRLSSDDMQNALQSTYASLMALKAMEETGSSTVEKPAASVNWRKSITKHSVICLECNATFKQLSGRHLRQHNLDGRTYRDKYGIPRTQPLSAKDTTTRRREVAQTIRPWEKAQEARAAVAKKGSGKKVAGVKE